VAAGIGISFLTNPIGGGILDISNPKVTFTLLSERTDVVTLHHDPTSFFVMVFQKPEAK
jgi:hypothetical protein